MRLFPFSFFASSAQFFGPVPLTSGAFPRLWISADAQVYKDAGSTLAANGETAQLWKDRSGHQKHVTQDTPLARAMFVTNVINGLPVLRFDGVDDFFDLSEDIGGDQTLFVVAKDNGSDKGSIILANTSVFGSPYLIMDQLDGPPGNPGFRYSHYDPNYAETATLPDLGFHLGTVVRSGVNGTAYLDGVAGTPTAALDDGDIRVLDAIGAYVTPGYSMEGDIAEILYYPVALNNTDRALVEAYLNNKYAIY